MLPRLANSLDRRVRIQPEVEIIIHGRHQHIHFIFEEMVGARNFLVVNGDVPLRAELIDQFLHRIRVHDFVIHALNDDAR